MIGFVIILGLNFLGFMMNLFEGMDLFFRVIWGMMVMSLILVFIIIWKIMKFDILKENVIFVFFFGFLEIKKFFGKLFVVYLLVIIVILF